MRKLTEHRAGIRDADWSFTSPGLAHYTFRAVCSRTLSAAFVLYLRLLG
jgi:hypothetical protein